MELARVAAAAEAGRPVVVLSPAHQWLYTPFDRAIGHFRRYTRRAHDRGRRASSSSGLVSRLGRLARLAGQPAAPASGHAHTQAGCLLGPRTRAGLRVARPADVRAVGQVGAGGLGEMTR